MNLPVEPKPGDTATAPDGSPLVWVPPGSADLRRPVTIPAGFWLGKHQVTNAQYRQFCRDASREFPPGSDQPDDHPVVYVTWHDAQAYCQHYGLRLPTEAEWEWAARGEQGSVFPWGNDWDQDRCCNSDNRGPGGQTFAVGHFPAGQSWCGALDLAGNVWEWCQDWFAADSQQAASERPDAGARPDADDPPGPGDARVLRGGGWFSFEDCCRAALRARLSPWDCSYLIGFRVALSPP